MSRRALLALVLALAALAVGVAGWSTPHPTGATVLGFVLAVAALHVAAPLMDGPPR